MGSNVGLTAGAGDGDILGLVLGAGTNGLDLLLDADDSDREGGVDANDGDILGFVLGAGTNGLDLLLDADDSDLEGGVDANDLDLQLNANDLGSDMGAETNGLDLPFDADDSGLGGTSTDAEAVVDTNDSAPRRKG